MTVKTNSTMDKIARAKAALKSGSLSNYAAAKPSNSADKKALTSWGSAMRR
jgi:hypothetical protein